MKRLNEQDWSLISRYLNADVSEQDMAQLDSIWAENPALKSRIDALWQSKTSTSFSPEDFDAIKAFQKLHERLQREDLI
ncbi:MAG TPA: hypothetical protein VIN08_17205 [Ohtaekwangia sp.]|uniref:hypothetical protein n=1 Tax=Ohtaekwangia sp. TaxID=2066019 RepID=UPI002F95D8B8